MSLLNKYDIIFVVKNRSCLITTSTVQTHHLCLCWTIVKITCIPLPSVCVITAGGFGVLSESWLKDKSPDNCLTSVEIYDPDANSWTPGPDLPVPLCAMGVVKYYGTIYVLGVYDALPSSTCNVYLQCSVTVGLAT